MDQVVGGVGVGVDLLPEEAELVVDLGADGGVLADGDAVVAGVCVEVVLGEEGGVGDHEAALVGVVGVGHPDEVGLAGEEAGHVEAVEGDVGVVEAGEVDDVDVGGSIAEVADFGGGYGGAGGRGAMRSSVMASIMDCQSMMGRGVVAAMWSWAGSYSVW